MDECKRWLATDDRRGQRPTSVVQTQTGLRVGTSVGRIVSEFARFATLDAGSEAKAFTDEVFGLDRASQAAILRGLFSADGTVANYGTKSQYVALDSVSLALLRQVQVLLLSFGVKSKIYRDRRPSGRRRPACPTGGAGWRPTASSRCTRCGSADRRGSSSSARSGSSSAAARPSVCRN
ncbi:MAG: LAGLIDADG family homing endonuclease [Phycisphaerales bacterium]